jgi:hypothetical protein
MKSVGKLDGQHQRQAGDEEADRCRRPLGEKWLHANSAMRREPAPSAAHGLRMASGSPAPAILRVSFIVPLDPDGGDGLADPLGAANPDLLAAFGGLPGLAGLSRRPRRWQEFNNEAAAAKNPDRSPRFASTCRRNEPFFILTAAIEVGAGLAPLAPPT